MVLGSWEDARIRLAFLSLQAVVQVLLSHGAAEDARDKNWQTPAHVAAANDAVPCMRLLIPAMSNVNITDRMGREVWLLGL